jgi:hypothetical protein
MDKARGASASVSVTALASRRSTMPGALAVLVATISTPINPPMGSM